MGTLRRRVDEDRIVELLTALKVALDVNRNRYVSLHSVMDSLGINSGIRQAITRAELVKPVSLGLGHTATYAWNGGAITSELAHQVLKNYVDIKSKWGGKPPRIESNSAINDDRHGLFDGPPPPSLTKALSAAMPCPPTTSAEADALDALAEEEDKILHDIYSAIEVLDERIDLIETNVQEMHKMISELYADLKGMK